MTTDGGLRKLFQKHIPQAHWQSVETWSTGQGVPDLNYCIEGREGWIELKAAKGLKVKFQPHQIAWLERRYRSGGRVWVAVRKRTLTIDQLWLVGGEHARELLTAGISSSLVEDAPRLARVYAWGGGPKQWGWDEIRELL